MRAGGPQKDKSSMCTRVQVVDNDNDNCHHDPKTQVIDDDNDDDDKSAARELQQREPGAPTLAKSSEAQPIKLHCNSHNHYHD